MSLPVLVLLAALGLFAVGFLLGLGFWCGLGFWLTRADRRTFGTAGPSPASMADVVRAHLPPLADCPPPPRPEQKERSHG